MRIPHPYFCCSSRKRRENKDNMIWGRVTVTVGLSKGVDENGTENRTTAIVAV
jgi:hypothetical protein